MKLGLLLAVSMALSLGCGGGGSGAPPVTSRRRTPETSRKASTSESVSRVIISVRVGPAFTWQCRQHWLQR